jgi:two-component system response regulator AtoC
MPAFTMPPPPPEPVSPVSMTNHADGVNLQELARTAAMGAEKEAIQLALERFRWNRRKTAEYLQVSYKTLLNKMKECGISESPTA